MRNGRMVRGYRRLHREGQKLRRFLQTDQGKALLAGNALLGTAAASVFAYTSMRTRRLSKVTSLLRLQKKAQKAGPLKIITDKELSVSESALRTWFWGVTDATAQAHKLAKGKSKSRKMSGVLLFHGTKRQGVIKPGRKAVVINSGKLPLVMSNKHQFGVLQEMATPGSVPETFRLSDALKKFGSMREVRKHFGKRGFVLKEIQGARNSIADLVTDKTRTGSRKYRKALKSPDKYVVQERLRMKHEFRVHLLNGVPYAAVHRRLPDGVVKRGYDAVRNALLDSDKDSGAAYIPVTGKMGRKLRKFAQKTQQDLHNQWDSLVYGKKGALGKKYHFHTALDIAYTKDGKFKILESQPIMGTISNPMIARRLERAVQGRWGRDAATAAAVTAGGGALAVKGGGAYMLSSRGRVGESRRRS